MTALGLVVRKDAVHLFQDSAGFDSEGRVVRIASKIVTRSKLNVAIGHMGMSITGATNCIDEWLKAQCCQRDVIEGLPHLFNKIAARAEQADSAGFDSEGKWGYLDIYVAMYVTDLAAPMPRGFMMTNRDHDGLKAYQRYGTDEVTSPNCGSKLGRAGFQPLRHCRDAIKAQRAISAETNDMIPGV